MIKLINEYDRRYYDLLKQVTNNITKKSLSEKINNNEKNNILFLEGENRESYEIYFSCDDTALGALKYQSRKIQIRKKIKDGLILIDVNPYLEISDISVDINLRNKKISKKLYNFILDYMQTNDASRVSRNILIGGVGLLGNKYDHTYSQLGIDKYIPIISRSIFSDEEWNNLENVRLETIGTKIYAERLGLKCIGSSKTHGGPIYLSENINEVLKKRV